MNRERIDAQLATLPSEQREILAGLPDRLLGWLLLFDAMDDDAFARAAFNTAYASGMWAELTLTPRAWRLQVWHGPPAPVAVIARVQPVQVHPAMTPGGWGRPDRAADYDHEETYRASRWPGTRLAAHVSLWFATLTQEPS